MCIQEGLKAANINRNGENGVTARLAEVNSQHKNNQLRRNALSGEIIKDSDIIPYDMKKLLVINLIHHSICYSSIYSIEFNNRG